MWMRFVEGLPKSKVGRVDGIESAWQWPWWRRRRQADGSLQISTLWYLACRPPSWHAQSAVQPARYADMSDSRDGLDGLWRYSEISNILIESIASSDLLAYLGTNHGHPLFNTEKLHIWVKWTPNLALFTAAFCSLRTHAN
jgi:hypothetical protein